MQKKEGNTLFLCVWYNNKIAKVALQYQLFKEYAQNMRYSLRWVKICTPEEIVLVEEVSLSILGVSNIETGYSELTGLSPGSLSVDQIKQWAGRCV